jgi:hypothetical protein
VGEKEKEASPNRAKEKFSRHSAAPVPQNAAKAKFFRNLS